MKYTNKRDTATGYVTASINIDYDVPKKGDMLCDQGCQILVMEDFKLGVDVEWNDQNKKYEGKPILTKDIDALPVFYGDVKILNYVKGKHSWSWRKGDYLKKA